MLGLGSLHHGMPCQSVQKKSVHHASASTLALVTACSIYNNITQLDLPTRRRQATTTVPDLSELPQVLLHPAENGVPVYVMLPLDTVWAVEREGRMFSVS